MEGNAPEAAAIRVVALLREDALRKVSDQVHVVAGVAAANVVAVVTAWPCRTLMRSGQSLTNALWMLEAVMEAYFSCDVVTRARKSCSVGARHSICSWQCSLVLKPNQTRTHNSQRHCQGYDQGRGQVVGVSSGSGQGSPMRPKETSPAWPL